MSRTLPNVVRNAWHPVEGGRLEVARILDHRSCPEGLDVDRIRSRGAGLIELDPSVGHFVSVLAGEVSLTSDRDPRVPLRLSTTSHAFIPPGLVARIDAPAGAELLRVSGASAEQARGTELLVRDERFLAACATPSETLRWVLTSQYLSRRIYLHHDATLLSRSGSPVSWYRTTMFDVAGLPPNDEGDPVFRMQYNSRTEFNVCYRVHGDARVRMAEHPYRDAGQAWGPWLTLDGDSTYHVNEAAGGIEEEASVDPETGRGRMARNRHEVYIADGEVTLFCLFDPAPTGIERHRPGAYSDYESLTDLLGSARYEPYAHDLTRFDEMVDLLSMAQARGETARMHGSSAWRLYEAGRLAQEAHESTLLDTLIRDGGGRERIAAQWASESTRRSA